VDIACASTGVHNWPMELPWTSHCVCRAVAFSYVLCVHNAVFVFRVLDKPYAQRIWDAGPSRPGTGNSSKHGTDLTRHLAVYGFMHHNIHVLIVYNNLNLWKCFFAVCNVFRTKQFAAHEILQSTVCWLA
jgi:hypothetical protein